MVLLIKQARENQLYLLVKGIFIIFTHPSGVDMEKRKRSMSRRKFLQKGGATLAGTALPLGATSLIASLFPESAHAQQQGIIGIPGRGPVVSVRGGVVTNNGVFIGGSVFHRGGRTFVHTQIGTNFGIAGNPFLFTGFGVSPFFNPFWGVHRFSANFCGGIAYFSGLPYFWRPFSLANPYEGNYYSFHYDNRRYAADVAIDDRHFNHYASEYRDMKEKYEELQEKYDALKKEFSDHKVADVEYIRQQVNIAMSKQTNQHEHPAAKEGREEDRKFTLESRYSGRVARNQFDDYCIEAFGVFAKAIESETGGSTRLVAYDQRDNRIIAIRDKNRLNAGDTSVLAAIDVGVYDNCQHADVLVNRFLDDVKKTNVIPIDTFNRAYSRFGVAYDTKFDACAA